ncbi:putative DNA mismatch repair protein, partial [Trichinella spiralis]
MQISYIHEAATKKKVKMLLAAAFLPLHDIPAAVELLGRDAIGSVAVLFNYFRVEWMPPDRLPLWN